MIVGMATAAHAEFRFRAESISHSVWLCYWFALS